MNCKSCGAELKENAKFCSKCGTKVEPDVCAKCNAPLKDGANFCPKCGTKVNVQANDVSPIKKEKQKTMPSTQVKQKKVEVSPDDIDRSQELADKGSELFDKKKYDEAINLLNKSITLNPDNCFALFIRARAYEEVEEYDRAISDYTEVLRLDTDTSDKTVYFARGDIYLIKEEYEKAISDFNEYIASDNTDADVFYSRARAYEHIEEYDRAISDYTEVLRLDPSYKLAYGHRGDVYREKKEFEKAISDYNEYITSDNTDAAAFNQRGNSYFDLGDYSSAIEDYNRAIKLEPKNKTFKENLQIAEENLQNEDNDDVEDEDEDIEEESVSSKVSGSIREKYNQENTNTIEFIIKNNLSFKDSDFYFYDDIPQKKRAGALQSYVTLNDNEEIICLFDSTVFGGAKEGICLTNYGIYWKEIVEEKNSVLFSDIFSIEMKNKHLVINNLKVETCNCKEKLKKTLEEIAALLKGVLK